MSVINYQDDLLVVVIGQAAAAAFDDAVGTVMAGELGMNLSGKEEAIRPLGSTADFIGAHFDASAPAQPVFRPVHRFWVTLQETVQSPLLAKHGLMPL